MIQLPILGAFIEAAGIVIEKKILKDKKISSASYTGLSFLAIVVAMAPFIYFLWQTKADAFSGFNLTILLFIGIFSVAANLLSYYALKAEKIIDFEPIWLMQPLFTIILAFIFYGPERKMGILILALIASLALVATHARKAHIKFDKYSIALILGNLFFSAELIASETILKYISPFTLYFIRCSFILVILLIFFRPSTKGIDKKTGCLIFFVGVIWVVYRLIIYYGYIMYGLVFTTILFILAPVLLLIMAKIFLKEKMTVRQVISTLIVIACVAGAIYLNS